MPASEHTTLIAVILGIYAAMSLVTLVMFWHDKRAAKKGNWRTPEKTLLSLALCGGWPGAILGMKLFRHKTRKWAFRAGVPVIGGLHVLAWIGVVWVLVSDTLRS